MSRRTPAQDAAHKARRRRRRYHLHLVRRAAHGLPVAELPAFAPRYALTADELLTLVTVVDLPEFVADVDGVLVLNAAGRKQFADELRRGGRNPGPKGGRNPGPKGGRNSDPDGPPGGITQRTDEGNAPSARIRPPAPDARLTTGGRRAPEEREGAQRSSRGGAGRGTPERVALAEGTEATEAPPPNDLASRDAPCAVRCVSGPRADGGLTLDADAPCAGWHPDVLGMAPGASEVTLVTPRDGEELAFRAWRTARVIKLTSTEDGTELTFIDGKQGPKVELRASRGALWSTGLDAWLRDWLPRAEQLAGIAPGALRVAQLDVCADFLAPPDLFTLNVDAARWTLKRKPLSLLPEPALRGHGYVSMHCRRHGNGGRICSLAVQHKYPHIVGETDDGDPRVYAPTWLRGGWDGASDVWRVEFRLRGNALTRRRGPDLPDPKNLTPENLRAAFDDAMTSYALVLPDRTTDPRWTALRAACAWAPVDHGAAVRDGQPLPPPTALERLRGRASMGLARLAHAVGAEDPEQAREVLDFELGGAGFREDFERVKIERLR